MSEYQKNVAMDWDDVIDNDGQEFILLPEGDYVFTVTNLERGYYNGSAKMEACNTADLTLEVRTTDGTAQIKTRIFLNRRVEWRMAAFFRCIGQKKRGEELKPRWNEVLGSRGIAHFKPRSYVGQDGEARQANDVARWIDYDATKMKAQAQPAADYDGIEDDIPF